MAVRDRKVVRKALIEKGMAEDDKHHKMLKKNVGGIELITRVSHGKGEIDDKLAKLMANQCCLSLREFWDLVDCGLTAESWDSQVRKKCPDGRNPYLRFG